MVITNFKENGVDIGTEFSDAFEKVAQFPSVFPSTYADPILATLYPDGVPGGLYGFGYNNFSGQLGLGHTASVSTTQDQVGTLTNWSSVSAGQTHTHMIKIDGTLWASGGNGNANLGDGTTISKSSPVQIGSLTNWKRVSSADGGSLAIKTDGTLWALGGYNNYGTLGLGITGQKSSPVQVGSLTNWSQVSISGCHSLAIKTDGTLWSWGGNSFGQLGDGTVVSKYSPVQVGTLTNWKTISAHSSNYEYSAHSLAIKTDGTLWSWGSNNFGQLGDGTTVRKSSPVQVGTLTNWKTISGGTQSNRASGWSLSTKTDGTLWSFGENSQWQLGDALENRSSPVQVGSLTNWKQVYSNSQDGSPYDGLASALKTDGTFWIWGYSNGWSNIRNSSPVQVGTLNTWKNVSFGNLNCMLIK